MSAPALVGAGRPTLRIRGTSYPVLLPTVRDPRLHLAVVIVSLQVLGQAAFDFSLSIAQILVALSTCAVLEVGIAFWRQRVIMWPASALLTGNGVAFILRVPGTQHGDWWSLRGAWIFAATAAVALLSKHVVRLRGRHLFNPSNFGLLLCFLLLGENRADPLDFWWAPMSPWLALALAIIVAGGLAILLRLRLLGIAVGFWLAFAAGIGVLAASGHAMTARWHLGPVSGGYFWWALVSSPEILVFLFFMITDPKTVPDGRLARRVFAVGVGLLAALLIAPQRTEFGSKVAVLGALALVCAVRPLIERGLLGAAASGDSVSARTMRLVRGDRLGAGVARRAAVGVTALVGAAGFAALLVLAGIPARSSARVSPAPTMDAAALPDVTVVPSKGVASQIDRRTALQISRDVAADLRVEADALRRRDAGRAAVGATGAWLAGLRQQIRGAARGAIVVPSYRVQRMRVTLEPGQGQGPPTVVAALDGTVQLETYRGSSPVVEHRSGPVRFVRTLELGLAGGRYLIVRSSGNATPALAAPGVVAAGSSPSSSGAIASALAGVHLADVARQVGLDFRQGAFRFGMSNDPVAMMGGGLCWLDYNNDGWLDLFVVNSYSQADVPQWQRHGGLPRSALFENVGGRFVDVSRRSGADLPVRGNGCVAADFNGDGYTDLYITTAGYDMLLWNNGDGTFTEGARAAGITNFGWHTGVAVADVNGDGRPDIFVSGYTDLNAPIAGSDAGFPTNHAGVRDLLYLNEGLDKNGHSRFREVGVQAGLESVRLDHGLGAVFTDFNHDGRPDLYVANDEDPNLLYENVRWPGGARADPAGLGFRFEERASSEGVADPNAGMGIAAADYSGDGRPDLFVTNARGQPHAVFRSRAPAAGGPSFTDARSSFAAAFGRSTTGWGASWVDLGLDGNLDLVLANGAIPVTSLARDAEPIQVLANGAARGRPGQFADASALVGVPGLPRVVGRGLAAADYDNDGRVDIAINSVGGPLLLLRETGAVGHWLEVKLDTFSPGAEVTAVLPDGRRLVRVVQAGGSYLSSEDPRLHFGLGAATRVRELLVRYPGGGEARLADVAADRIVLVKRPAAAVPERAVAAAPSSYLLGGCVRSGVKGRSVARIWDEAMLDAIRRDTPAPTTAARNLFHVSAAMWDAWAAYDPKADGYFVTEKDRAPDVQAAREAAISYAAYRLLLWRYSYGGGMRQTFDELTSTMRSLCYQPDFISTKGDSPAALGNRIAAAAIAYGRRDGSLEQDHYGDPSYAPVNGPLIVSQPGTAMHDPTLWQPLALGQIVSQDGVATPARVQTFVGAQWGHVRAFALPPSKAGLPIDPGAPPLGTPSDPVYKRAAVDLIRLGSELGQTDGKTIDVGPAARGGNPPGTNDGHGYRVNPATGKPYALDRVRRADFERAVARLWADEPGSETPPGHWNAIANAVSDSPQLAARIGSGAANRLRWDVKLYFALNGAAHDAAIAAWGAKRTYQSVRPISMIRYMAGRGQSSDRRLPSYDREGLPLVPGLIELITRRSSAPGGRHAGLAEHVGEIAVRSWRGAPKGASGQGGGVGWILGTRWVPYQSPSFVTPAFPGFVSGQSTFGRAAAEVLAAYTGSRYFPGGLLTVRVPAGGPALAGGRHRAVDLQFATYDGAADQAGSSSLYEGNDVAADDLAGRAMGAAVGKKAYALASRYFDGTARR